MRFLLGATLLLAGCGGGGSASDGSFGIAQREVVSGLQFPTGVAQPGPLARVRAFPALSFNRPVKITHAGDGTNRLFVAEQDGRIRVFANDNSVATSTVFLDIRGRVRRNGNEEGLLGLAFDPDFANNGFLYVNYSASNPRRTVISRFTASGGVADPGSELVLLRYNQPYGNHNGGDLAFGPEDGMLYVASGDGGSGGDPQNNAQNLDTFLGKILRMRPDGTAPDDNPFFTGAGGARDFIWAYGLRNPWRMSFDRLTSDLWAGDVGQNAIEEIDIIVEGGNYGWRFREGDSDFNNPDDLPPSSFEEPVQTYSHSLGVSVTGGYVYRGTRLASLVGAYLYGDFATGRIWALVHDGSRVVSNVQVGSVTNPSSFGEDEAGELFVCSFDGGIYRFDQTNPPPGAEPPAHLSATGLFSDLANLTPVAGLVPYGVNAELWSDGARKRRWIALPGNATVDFHATGAWGFPTGTVLVKQFDLETSPGTLTKVETRVLVLRSSGWAGYAYRWNESGSDATLLEDGETGVYTITDASGSRNQTWSFHRRERLAEPDLVVPQPHRLFPLPHRRRRHGSRAQHPPAERLVRLPPARRQPAAHVGSHQDVLVASRAAVAVRRPRQPRRCRSTP
ncbi:MAG: PQQ-dependent sugar dehydrogenase [Planctomycetota bacterium]|jgi:glucose/arabinose dehydrogenase